MKIHLELVCLQSMNTVMDDNRMLTLASNERIPLTPSMRLLLEINHMNHCSPATVSRGGVIYVNATDIGWQPVRSKDLYFQLVVEVLWGVNLPFFYFMSSIQMISTRHCKFLSSGYKRPYRRSRIEGPKNVG